MTEYMVVISGVLLISAVMYEFLDHIGDFYINVVKMVSLPFP